MRSASSPHGEAYGAACRCSLARCWRAREDFRELDRRSTYDVEIRELAQQSEPARCRVEAIGPDGDRLVASMGDRSLLTPEEDPLQRRGVDYTPAHERPTDHLAPARTHADGKPEPAPLQQHHPGRSDSGAGQDRCNRGGFRGGAAYTASSRARAIRTVGDAVLDTRVAQSRRPRSEQRTNDCALAGIRSRAPRSRPGIRVHLVLGSVGDRRRRRDRAPELLSTN